VPAGQARAAPQPASTLCSVQYSLRHAGAPSGSAAAVRGSMSACTASGTGFGRRRGAVMAV